MQIPKILRPFFKLTVNEKSPTDEQLDEDIKYLSHIMIHIWPVISRIMNKKIKRFFMYRWKYVIGRIIIISLVGVLGYYAFVKALHVRIVRFEEQPVKEMVTSYPSDSTMNLRNFLLQIAYLESRYEKTANRPKSQFWGLYQVGTDARKVAGYADVPMDVFLNHPEIQDLCMIETLKYNKKYMRDYISKYNGKIVDGILVTESGILALCQLGTGSAKSYLDKASVPELDKNGNSPRSLLKMGGYTLNLDKVRYSIQDAVVGEQTIK